LLNNLINVNKIEPVETMMPVLVVARGGRSLFVVSPDKGSTSESVDPELRVEFGCDELPSTVEPNSKTERGYKSIEAEQHIWNFNLFRVCQWLYCMFLINSIML
jgi:hypothetical protein